MIVSVVRARKSIFSRPIFSTSVIGYIVVISSLLDLYSGTKSVSGCGEITTPGGVRRGMPRQTFKRCATSISSFDARHHVWTRAFQVGILLQRLVERDVQFGRNHLRDLVDFGICHFHAAAGVLDDAAGRHAFRSNDLRDVFAAVLLRHVVDDAPRRFMQKSMSISGSETRSGFRKRSNSSPYCSGSMSVMRMQ